MKPYRVIVAGSRGYTDYQFVKTKLDVLLSSKVEEGYTIIIVSGKEPTGADALGEKYAKERGYFVDEYPAQWNDIQGKPYNELGKRKDGSLYWKKAGPARNEEMAAIANACVIFRVNMSYGSTDMYNRAQAHKLAVRVYDITK